MYWPDYTLGRKRPRARRGPLFLLALFLGLVLTFLIGWWKITAPIGGSPIEAISEVAAETADEPPTDGVPSAYVPQPTPAPSRNAADFALPDLLDEAIVVRRSDYEGRPLILNFWASWCVPCREEMPALQRTFDAYEGDGLMVLGINETYIDNLEAAQTFVGDLDLTFPSVRDDNGKVSEELYRVLGLPTSVFVTPTGEIAHIQIGQMSEEQISSYSRQLLAGGAISPLE